MDSILKFVEIRDRIVALGGSNRQLSSIPPPPPPTVIRAKVHRTNKNLRWLVRTPINAFKAVIKQEEKEEGEEKKLTWMQDLFGGGRVQAHGPGLRDPAHQQT